MAKGTRALPGITGWGTKKNPRITAKHTISDFNSTSVHPKKTDPSSYFTGLGLFKFFFTRFKGLKPDGVTSVEFVKPH